MRFLSNCGCFSSFTGGLYEPSQSKTRNTKCTSSWEYSIWKKFGILIADSLPIFIDIYDNEWPSGSLECLKSAVLKNFLKIFGRIVWQDLFCARLKMHRLLLQKLLISASGFDLSQEFLQLFLKSLHLCPIFEIF